MDPSFLVLMAIVVLAAGAWVLGRRRSDARLTPEEHLEQAALRAERDRQRNGSVEAADRFDING
jgi:hypothetical protein